MNRREDGTIALSLAGKARRHAILREADTDPPASLRRLTSAAREVDKHATAARTLADLKALQESGCVEEWVPGRYGLASELGLARRR